MATELPVLLRGAKKGIQGIVRDEDVTEMFKNTKDTRSLFNLFLHLDEEKTVPKVKAFILKLWKNEAGLATNYQPMYERLEHGLKVLWRLTTPQERGYLLKKFQKYPATDPLATTVELAEIYSTQFSGRLGVSIFSFVLRHKIWLGLVALVLFCVGFMYAGIWLYGRLTGKKSQQPEVVKYDAIKFSDTKDAWNREGTVSLSDSAKKVMDNSRFTLCIKMHIDHATSVTEPRYLVAWGPIVVMLQTDTNDLFVGFGRTSIGSPAPSANVAGATGDTGTGRQTVNTGTGAAAPLSEAEKARCKLELVGGGGGGAAAEDSASFPGVADDAAAAAAGNKADTIATQNDPKKADMFKNSHCLCQVKNVSMYCDTLFHLVYDFNSQSARMYLDGRLVKVCNFFNCNDSTKQVNFTDDLLVYPQKSTTSDTGFSAKLPLSAPAGVVIKSVGLKTGLASRWEIQAEAEKFGECTAYRKLKA
jgi:hypothetical protein